MDIAMKIGYWNCGKGLTGKLDFLKEKIDENEMTILFVAESELNVMSNQSALKIKNFELIHSKSMELGKNARISCFVSNDSNFIRRNDLEIEGNEIIVLENSTRSELVVGFYRPFKQFFDTETATSGFERLLLNFDGLFKEKKNVLLIGDINIDFLQMHDSSYRLNGLCNKLNIFIEKHSLIQTVKSKTRFQIVNKNGQNVLQSALLDHVYVNNLAKIEETLVLPGIMSDHEIILVKTKTSIWKRPVKKVLWYTDWKNYSKSSLTCLLNEVDWSTLAQCTSAQQYCSHFEAKVQNAFLSLVEERQLKIRKHSDFISPRLEELKRKMNTSYKRGKKTGRTELFAKAKAFGKKIKIMAREERRKKTRSQIKDSKSMWKTVNANLGKIEEDLPDLCFDGKIGTTDTEKADLFAEFFVKKVSECASETNPTLNTVHGSKIEGIDGLSQGRIIFSIDLLLKVMKTVKRKKCFGFDRIPMLVYVDGFDVLKDKICVLFNMIAQEEMVPEQWRMARIMPLHKKGQKSKCQNYRPISNLCSIAKLYEKCILSYVGDLEARLQTDITGTHQHGFKKGHSTITATLLIQNEISSLIEQGKKVLVSSCDLTAAFDLLRSDIFEERCKAKGLPVHLTKLMLDWIKNRSGYVEVNGEVSCFFDVKLGCVQGSCLGPLIFAIYVSPISELGLERIVSFADDAYLINSGYSMEEIKTRAENDLTTLTNWFADSGMLVNKSKTDACIFSRRDEQMIELTFGNSTVQAKKEIKILGVWFDSKMTWQKQVFEAINRTRRVLHGLKIICSKYSRKELYEITTSLAFSTLYYGAEIWLNCCLRQREWAALRRIHIECIRLCQRDFKRKIKIEELLQISPRATPRQMGKFIQAKTLIKIVNEQKPTEIFEGLLLNHLCERRFPNRLYFCDTNRLRISRNMFCNRIALISREITFDWFDITISKDLIRMNLKRCFF